jgi:beta-lactamase class C
LLAASTLVFRPAGARAQISKNDLARLVAGTIRPIMIRNKVPGMAVALTAGGRRSFFFYGVASKESGQKVTEDTLFEIGSISKIFTATLACLAQLRGALSLSDRASQYLPALAGTDFDRISLLDQSVF